MTEEGSRGPLDGLVVLEFAQVLAGPLCGMMLADMGAEVLKIERPEGGDLYRRTGAVTLNGESTNFLSTNRNKKSVVLDLPGTHGREAVLALAAVADVVLENFVPGTTERLGIDYSTLALINPRLIYCSITGFGASGPSAHLPAVDPVIQAASGIMSLTGSENGDPVRVGTPVGDIYAAMCATQGILLAVVDRHRTGRGQRVEVSLLDAAIFGLIPREGEYFASGEVPPTLGTAHSQFVPFQAFPTADRPIFVAAFHDQQWLRLCSCLGREDLSGDIRFRTGRGRADHRVQVVTALTEVFRRKPSAAWLAVLQSAKIPVSVIQNLDQVFTDPQVLHNRMVVEMNHPTAGAIRGVANPIRLSEHGGRPAAAPPLLGQHTDEILDRFGIPLAGSSDD